MSEKGRRKQVERERIRAMSRNVYLDTPRGIMRNAEELWLRLNGETVDWLRVDPDPSEVADMERLLKAALARSSSRA